MSRGRAENLEITTLGRNKGRFRKIGGNRQGFLAVDSPFLLLSNGYIQPLATAWT
jgi:hypothetical protein